MHILYKENIIFGEMKEISVETGYILNLLIIFTVAL